jgi:WD40 repeat protein
MNPLRRAARLLILLGALFLLPAMLRAQGTVPTAPAINTNLAAITLENAAQITSLARIGRGPVNDLAWSPDGSRLAVAGSAGLWLYDAAAPEAEPLLLEGHPDRVTAVDFSPDGLLIVSGAADGRLRLWDATAGALLWTATADEDEVHQAAFAPDGLTIASSGSEGGAALWDVATGTLIRMVGPGRLYDDRSVAWADETLLVAVDTDETFTTWDVTTGEAVQEVQIPGGSVSIAVSPDGKTAAISTLLERIVLLDVASGQIQGTLTGLGTWVSQLAFDADGKTLIAGTVGGTISLWDLTTQERRAIIAEGVNSIAALSVSADGDRLVYATSDGRLTFYNLLNPDLPGETVATHNARPTSIALSPDDAWIAAGGGPGMNWRWAWRDSAIIALTPDVADVVTVSELAYAASSDRLVTLEVSAEFEITLILRDLASGGVYPLGAVALVPMMAVSPDGRSIAAAGGQNVSLWNVETALAGSTTPAWSLTAEALALAFSPDSQRIAVALVDRVQVIDLATQAVVTEYLWSGDRFVGDMAWSPDGRMLAVAHLSLTTIYDTATGSVIAERAGDSRFGSAIAFSPDSTLLALGNDAYQIEVHETISWDRLAILEDHMGSIIDLEISADSQIIVSASIDGTVRLWGVPQG